MQGDGGGWGGVACWAMRGGWGGVACWAMRAAGDAWWVVCNSVRCFLSLRKCLPDRQMLVGTGVPVFAMKCFGRIWCVIVSLSGRLAGK